jgi:hypothetical protein
MTKKILSIVGLALLSCKPNQNEGVLSVSENHGQYLATVASQSIFFGHQSVGNNILEGMKELSANHPASQPTIVESRDVLPETGGFFLHSRIGENTKPVQKCNDFLVQLTPELVESLDYAMFKFCYIDIDRNTDVTALFEHYRNTINEVKERYPGLTICHITAPIRHSPNDFTTKLRELVGNVLGKPNNSKLDNAKRNEYNRLLLAHYSDEPIFDLAEAEATHPDGRKNTFEMNGEINYNLVAEYTYDGGHLNEMGRKKIAADFIKFLSSISSSF